MVDKSSERKRMAVGVRKRRVRLGGLLKFKGGTWNLIC